MADKATEKLHKVLAGRGVGSRRTMERWIADGRVKVNGRVARVGDRVSPSDQIMLDGRKLARATGDKVHRVIVYNKPAGRICARKDPEGRPTVFSQLPKLVQGRWISVGRLDFNTSGLLLFTTDGELANRLTHPSFQIEREYAVRVLGNVSEKAIGRLLTGVEIDGQMCRFSDVQEAGGEGANHWYYVVLMGGRNREVRRLWESQKITVSRLKRVRFGNIFIPSQVKSGKCKDLAEDEIVDLYQSVKLTANR